MGVVTLLRAALSLAVPARAAAAFTLLHGVDDPQASVRGVLDSARRWSAPASVGSSEGFGGGIAYALDRRLCAQLLPRFVGENYEAAIETLDPLLLAQYTGCDQLVDALIGAMATWEHNHPHISFKRDTSPCAGLPDCATTEIFFSTFDDDGRSTTGRSRAGFTQVLSYTVGEARTFLRARAPAAPSPPPPAGANGSAAVVCDGADDVQVVVPSLVLHRVDVRFNQSMCWYLDSAWCAALNSQRTRGKGAADGLETGLLTALCLVWTLCAGYLASLALRLIQAKPADGAWSREQVPEAVFAGIGRRERAVLAATKFRAERILLAVSLMVMLPLMWRKVFAPCLNCYDFGGTAAHELGHALGLDHPDVAPSVALVADGDVAGARGGEEEQELLLGARRAVACGERVEDHLRVSESAPAASSAYSVMHALTQFTPQVCLGQGDLDGLNALYPACDAATLQPPMCVKTHRASGVSRTLGTILLPLFLSAAAVHAVMAVVRRRAKAAELAMAHFLHSAAVVPGARDVDPATVQHLAQRLRHEEARMHARLERVTSTRGSGGGGSEHRTQRGPFLAAALGALGRIEAMGGRLSSALSRANSRGDAASTASSRGGSRRPSSAHQRMARRAHSAAPRLFVRTGSSAAERREPPGEPWLALTPASAGGPGEARAADAVAPAGADAGASAETPADGEGGGGVGMRSRLVSFQKGLAQPGPTRAAEGARGLGSRRSRCSTQPLLDGDGQRPSSPTAAREVGGDPPRSPPQQRWDRAAPQVAPRPPSPPGAGRRNERVSLDTLLVELPTRARAGSPPRGERAERPTRAPADSDSDDSAQREADYARLGV
ncbi:hypothetical protein KFE25_010464 [Diacronema lutheri]|uniref:Peptidase M10 metallopeptidase domain-containing protein n=1 Tax=Diacronema lutheri TaxID=2081491 RepID=A0A8J5XCU3_DIALT|nr:hypothetical protein KFE25_010464 [Diacronema lutheri]